MSENSNTNHASASGNASAQLEIGNNVRAKTNFTPTARLTSYLAPRDLTLSGNSVKLDKPRKVYIPNLNAQRKKKEEEPLVTQKCQKGSRNKHKGKGQDRENRHKSNLIQSTGVFSEGLSEAEKSKFRFSGFRDQSGKSEPREALQRPKLNSCRSINKEEEEHKLKLLLRDDFIEDDNDVDYQNSPIVLPVRTKGKLLKEECEVKIEEEKVKTEILNKEKAKLHNKEKLHIKENIDKKCDINVSQSLESKASGYFLIRFPDCLPGALKETEEDELRTNKNTEGRTNMSTEATPLVEKSKDNESMLNNLKEGLLGKLEILKSGAARLSLGENKLIVELGPQIFSRQDVIAAKIDNEKKAGELVNLGLIHTNLICTPNWESMI